MLTDWERWFPGCEPLAHHLTVVFPARWVRFHSLPESKRYPEEPAEYATVLERHNRVLGLLAARGETVALLTTGWSDTTEPVRCQPELVELDPQARPWRTVAMHRQPDNAFMEPTFWHVFASARQWTPGVFDPLVRLVAQEVLENLIVAALDCRWLFAPYDGGMDVLVESRAARDGLANRHPQWLAPEWLSAGDARDVGLDIYGSRGRGIEGQ
jgi:hypothetical protein